LKSKKYFLKKDKRAKRREVKSFKIKISKINYKCIANKTIVDVEKDLSFIFSLEFFKDISTRDMTPEEVNKYKKYTNDALERTENAVLESQRELMNTSAPTRKDINISWNEITGNPTDDLKEFKEWFSKLDVPPF
jgi:hypothetical protein